MTQLEAKVARFAGIVTRLRTNGAIVVVTVIRFGVKSEIDVTTGRTWAVKNVIAVTAVSIEAI